MGQVIANDIRELLRTNRRVREVTREHVILNNGAVVDPAEFIAQTSPARFILKLVRCGCWLSHHRRGEHCEVAGFLDRYADNHFEHRYTITICPKGEWVMEEVVLTPERKVEP